MRNDIYFGNDVLLKNIGSARWVTVITPVKGANDTFWGLSVVRKASRLCDKDNTHCANTPLTCT